MVQIEGAFIVKESIEGFDGGRRRFGEGGDGVVTPTFPPPMGVVTPTFVATEAIHPHLFNTENRFQGLFKVQKPLFSVPCGSLLRCLIPLFWSVL